VCVIVNCCVYNIIQFFKFLRARGRRNRKKERNFLRRMTDTSQYLSYLQEQQALACRSCKYCLQPNGVESHLQRKHSAVPLKIYKKLMNYAESLILRKSSKVVTPVIIVFIFDCLKIIERFCCLMCNYLYEILSNIKEYCKDHR